MTLDCFSDPQGTDEEILAATYRTLVRHGYANLTIKRIGNELNQSPSLIYHHYDDKDDLVLACLEFMLEHFSTELTSKDVTDASAYLAEFVAWTITAFDRSEDGEFLSLLLDLRVLAIHDDDYEAHFTRSDAMFQSHLSRLVNQGVAAGALDLEDPNATAELLYTVLLGAMVRAATTNEDDWKRPVREMITRDILD